MVGIHARGPQAMRENRTDSYVDSSPLSFVFLCDLSLCLSLI